MWKRLILRLKGSPRRNVNANAKDRPAAELVASDSDPENSSHASKRSAFDHLVPIRDQGLASLQVPCVATPYDGDDYLTFPETRDFNPALLWEGILDGKSLSEVESFLQTWLFFGLLVEVFKVAGLELDQNSFTYEDDDGRQWITMRALNSYTRQWLELWKHVNPDQRMERALKIAKFFRFTEAFAKRHIAMSGKMTEQGLVRPEIGLSLVILAENLNNATYRILDQYIPTGTLTWSSLSFFPIRLVQDRLILSGLCPATVNVIELTYSMETQYYISTFLQPESNMSHSDCYPDECRSTVISRTPYRTRHVPENCRCDHLTIDTRQLCSILAKEGGIPIVVVDDEPLSSSSEIRVVEANENNVFVAISHVWAHGMGNEESNSLPACLLGDLKSLVKRTAYQENICSDGKSLGFWIDTVCVPAKSENANMRRQAIIKMEATYQRAERVLVLDTGLQKLRGPNNATELRHRIVLSEWWRRLWTLQEGVLANQMCIAFADAILNLDSVEKQEYEEAVRMESLAWPSALSNTVFDSTRRFIIRSFEGWRNGTISVSTGPQINLLSMLVAMLAGRATTKAEDEGTCLSILLGYVLDDVLQTQDHSERMNIFYSKLKTVPPDLLFFRGAKLKQDGFRWAPSSFLQPFTRDKLNILRAGLHPVVRDDMLGICIPYPVLYLSVFENNATSKIPETRRLFIWSSESARWFMVTQLSEFGDDRDTEPLPPLNQAAVVVPEYVPSERNSWLQRGALVSVTGAGERGLYSRFICPVDVRELTGQHGADWADSKWPFLKATKSGFGITDSQRIICKSTRRDHRKLFWVA